MGLCGMHDGRSTGAMAIKEDPRPRKKRMRRVPDGQAHGGYDPLMCDASEPAGPCGDLIRWLDEHDGPTVRMITDNASLPAWRAIPGTIPISGTAVQISASLWRNFMPGPRPGGRPLNATVRVSAAAGALLPAVRAERIMVISGEQAWIAPAAEETAWARSPSHLEVMARNGPEWEPGVLVDVVLELRDAEGQEHLIRLPDVEIKRAD